MSFLVGDLVLQAIGQLKQHPDLQCFVMTPEDYFQLISSDFYRDRNYMTNAGSPDGVKLLGRPIITSTDPGHAANFPAFIEWKKTLKR